jgi:glycine dehydrogenase subunit 1
MDYIPTTESDRKNMLKKIGVKSIKEITQQFVPVFNNTMQLPEPLSEQELIAHLTTISKMNVLKKYFVGAGSYHHYIPSAIGHLIKRGEFLTGYTPYQAEVSQGVLQAIYEYQSYMCVLTGMDVANASLYDGPSALAEAIVIASSYNGRKKVVVEDGLHPAYLEVISTYCRARDLLIRPLNGLGGERRHLDNETACVIVQNPDFYGNIRDLGELSSAARESGTLFIVCVVEPTSLAIIRPPGQYGADIVVGEGQSFGIPMSFGGPSLGFMAVKSYLLKKIPGRICGMATDSKGNRGFVLTLQAREQHIRRERATSNITTNVALMALSCTIYLALMGRTGLKNIAEVSMRRAHLLQEKLQDLGFLSLNNCSFYNEFTLKVPSLSLSRGSSTSSTLSASSTPALKGQSEGNGGANAGGDQKIVKAVMSKLSKNGIVGGLALDRGVILICCTEMNALEDIETYESVVKGVLQRSKK